MVKATVEPHRSPVEHWEEGEVRQGFPGEKVSVERKSGVFCQRTGDEGSIPDGRNKSKDPLTHGMTGAGNSKQTGITRAVVLNQGDFALCDT